MMWSSILLFMIMAPLMALWSVYRHFLLCLLALEYITLAMIMTIMFLIMSNTYMEFGVIMMILCLGACEASVGLACLVMMSRGNFTDYLISMNLAVF